VETQMIDKETADLAVPAAVLDEPERTQANFMALGQRLGLELTDTLVDCFASVIDHPRDVIRRDETIGRIIRLAANPFEKRNPLRIIRELWLKYMLVGGGPAQLSKTKNGHACAQVEPRDTTKTRAAFPVRKEARATDAARLTIR